MSRVRILFHVELMLLLVFLLAAPALAQYGASLRGTVTDKSGAVVAGATVTITNQDTGVVYPAVTGDTGLYRVAALVPGRYTVKVEGANFRAKSVTNIVVAAEDSKNQDVTLELGAVSESVTVTADAVALKTENGDVSGSITAQDVQRLPQVGRDPYELLRLAPGVVGDNARGTGNVATYMPGTEALGGASSQGIFQTENQPQISANGQRVSSNNYEIDGVSVNSLGLGGAAVVTPSEESIQEVKVVTSSYTAEDGRNIGAQIKVISQNGTNKLHGSGVLVFDDKGLNAFNKYYGPQSITPSLLNCQDHTKIFASQCPERVDTKQRLFGGSLGGPVLKDKLFFFFSYEGLRQNNSSFTPEWIETPEFRTYVHNVRPGSLADELFSFPGVVPRIISAGLTPPSPPFGNPIQGQLGLSYDIGSLAGVAIGQKVPGSPCPLPCSVLGPPFFDGIPDVTYANVALPSTTDANQYHLRVDYNRSKDQFGVSGYLTLLNNVGTFGSDRPFQDHPLNPKNSAAMVTWIHTFSPTILNEARLNFTRFYDDEFSNISKNLHIPQLDTNGFNFNGGDSLGLPGGGGLQYGADFNLPKLLVQNTFEFRDILSKQIGNKTWKVGAQIIREQDNSLQRQHARHQFFFDNFLSLANDAPFFENSADIDPLTGGTPHSRFYFRASSYNFFVQNDWKVRQNLTVNLGVRYEYTTPVSEKNGRLSNYIPGPNGIIDGHVAPVSQLYEPDRNNFAPRIGFAYAPTRSDGKMVFRGGVGMGYDRQFFNLVKLARFNPPFAAAGIGLCCDAGGGILYSFSLPNDPLSYPPNPALQSGLDPVTGGLLAPSPVALPGGFVRNDQYIEVNGTPGHLPVTYVYNYSFEMQYQLLKRTFFSLAYQGSAGHKLIRTIDMNRFTPGDSFNCAECANRKDMVQEADVDFNPITPRLTGNPNFDRIFFPLPDVSANYNSMVLHVSQVYGHGFQLNGNYRWSKSLDTSSFGRGAQQTDPSQQGLDYGPSDFDVRHQFVFFGLWDLPIFRGQRGFVGKALGGWQINGVLTVHSGFPWTPEEGCCIFGRAGDFANDINGDGIGNDFPTQWDGQGGTASSNQSFINGVFPKNASHPNGGFDYFNIDPGCSNFPIDCVSARKRGNSGIGRNRFRGPAYHQIDMTLGKHTLLPGFLHLGEAAALDLRANFFNIFNMLNLPPFQTGGQSNTDFTNGGDFGRATKGLAGRVMEVQIRLSF